MTGNGISSSGQQVLQNLNQEKPSEKADMGLREHRCSSDAGVHAISRSRAAATAAAARAKSHKSQNYSKGSPLFLQHLQQHHLLQQQHHSNSNSNIPVDVENSLKVFSGGKPTARRAHSQSSIARLGVKHQTDHASTLSLPRSRRALSEEEEVTYVWRDGRVQLHHPHAARNGVSYRELATSGQHVEYMWQSGNVQRVVRGSNNEMLSAEVVPPRGEIKGLNYCIILSLLGFFVVAIVSLVFVLKVLY